MRLCGKGVGVGRAGVGRTVRERRSAFCAQQVAAQVQAAQSDVLPEHHTERLTGRAAQPAAGTYTQ